MATSAAPMRTPAHLWVVGILSLLWNCFGGYDYLMSRTHNMDYLASMTPPGVDVTTMIDYIDGMPMYAQIGWGLGVWAALVGSVLLLMRNRYAVWAFGLSIAGMIMSFGYMFFGPPHAGKRAGRHDEVHAADHRRARNCAVRLCARRRRKGPAPVVTPADGVSRVVRRLRHRPLQRGLRTSAASPARPSHRGRGGTRRHCCSARPSDRSGRPGTGRGRSNFCSTRVVGCGTCAEHPGREAAIVLQPHAAVAEPAVVLREQLLVRRVVQVDAVIVGHLELHVAHRIPRPRQLADAGSVGSDLARRDRLPVDRLGIDDLGVGRPVGQHLVMEVS